MRPTFLGFETARRGLMVSQKGLDITGQNLTNIDTPGYTRQRVDLVAMGANSYRSRFSSSRAELAGQGVNLNGISQTRDSFLDKRFREEYGEVRYHDQASAILSDISNAMDEFSYDGGMMDAIQEITKALRTFTENTDSSTFSNLLSTSFKNVALMFHQLDEGLKKVAGQQKYNMSVAVSEANTAFEKIAALNKSIAEDMAANRNNSEYFGPNELLDQRNLLLDELSQYCDLDVTQNHDGTVTLKVNGHTAVDQFKFDTFSYTEHNDGTVALNWKSTGQIAELTTGALKASTDFINGRGPNASSSHETVEKGILYYQDRLDTFAATFARTVNNILPATVDQDGNVINDGKYKTLLGATVPKKVKIEFKKGTEITALTAAQVADLTAAGSTKKLFQKTDGTYYVAENPVNPANQQVDFMIDGGKIYNKVIPNPPEYQEFPGEFMTTTDVPITAANISISDEWVRNPGYAVTGNGDTKTGYVNTLLNALETDSLTFNSKGESFNGTFMEYLKDYTINLNTEVSFHNTRFDTTSSIADELLDQRDAISGVSKEEEGINMMNYQKSFQAISRLMTAMDEALDVLINKTGLVGR